MALEDAKVHDVFISYSRKNAAFIQKVHQELVAQGLDVWLDTEDILGGSSWRKEVSDALDASANVAFFMSPASVISRECHQELWYAKNNNKRIIPLIYEGEYDALQLAWRTAQVPHAQENGVVLENTNSLSFRESDNLNEALKRLTTAIDKDKEHVIFHTRLLTQAKRWEQSSSDPALLLKADELKRVEAWKKQNEYRKALPTITDLQTTFIKVSRREEDQTAKISSLTDRQFLGLRYAGAAIGTGFGFGIITYALINDVGGLFALNRVLDGIATGALYGIFMGFALLVATQLRYQDKILLSKLPPKSTIDLLVAGVSGALLCLIVFIFYRVFRQPDFNLVWFLISSLLLTLGFTLPTKWPKQLFLRWLVGSTGVFLALWLPWVINHDYAIFNFQTLEYGDIALPASALFASITSLCTLLPEAFESKPGE